MLIVLPALNIVP